jgi:hypothetical protein
MNNGYIPKTVIDRVNGWLADYRTGKEQAPIDVAE